MAKPPSARAPKGGKPSASKTPPQHKPPPVHKRGQGMEEGPQAAFKAKIKEAISVTEGAPAIWQPHRPERTWEKFEGGRKFRVASSYEPAGDQPQAIADLVAGVRDNEMDQVLLGVTGS